jgi:transposase
MKAKARPDLQIIPMLAHESLYIGVDIGKFKHIAGFVSTTLLARFQRFEGCPALVFEQSREGFRALVDRIGAYVPIQQAYVLLERTGHYHHALQQYLLEMGISVFVIHVQHRPAGLLKSDKRDALSLANHLYSQLELGAQVADKLHLVHRAVPPTEAAAQLRGMTRHREELIMESTQRKNKLTALCDEIFPELTRVLKDPNSQTALALRAAFPTPQAVATASLSALQTARQNRQLTDTKLVEIQRLAEVSIGVKDPPRLRGLVFEQGQLIRELNVIHEHLEQLEAEMKQIVEHSREGTILTSIPPIGPIQAAALIASIGHIANFESAAKLKSYFGWAPASEQTGVSYDRARLTRRGNRSMKRMMYLIVWQAIQTKDTEWARLYERLVPRLCSYDERKQSYTGKGKVIGRLAGQIISVIYALLKKDDETLKALAPGEKAPEPVLYDPEIHRQHCTGQYHAPSSGRPPRKIIQLPTN